MRIPARVARTFSLCTIGCRLNQYEIEAVGARLETLGFRQVEFGMPSDLCVINTCSVTSRADSDARSALRRARRSSPAGRVMVTGCFATAQRDQVDLLAAADLVVDNRDKDQLVDRLMATYGWASAPALPTVRPAGEPEAWPSRRGRTRAMVKIQDGCQEACTYCIIPRARGRERSRPPSELVAEIRGLVEAGYKEVVLTGVHVGKYRFEGFRLPDLLCEVLRRTAVEQIRLTSLEPREFRSTLVDLFADEPRLCPHLHVPVQSGHDEILRRMNRSYDTSFVRDLFERLVASRPGLALGTDVMVGFPGESDAHFRATESFLGSLPLAYLHVFSYSDRPGTAASGLCEKVPESVIRDRSKALRELGWRLRRRYQERFVGRTLPVLVERRRDRVTGHLVGLSDNYLRVLAEGPDEWMNRILPLRIVRFENDVVFARAA